MNNQQLFDKVCKHLAKQEKPALDSITGDCRYLTEDGLKCAIGCLLTKKELVTYGEAGTDVYGLFSVQDKFTYFSIAESGFLNDLQGAHDHSNDINTLKGVLKSIGKNYKLKISEVNRIKKWGK